MEISEIIKDTQSVWERIISTKKPVVLYGMGNGAQKVLNVLDRYGIHAAGVFASDEFVRGQEFCGYKVKSFSQIREEFEDFIILLSFGTCLPELMEKIYHMAGRYELYAPDIPVADEDTVFTKEYAQKHLEKLEHAYTLMADSQSKKVFENIVKFKISGQIELLKKCESQRDEIPKLLALGTKNGAFVDLGAYNGDTVAEYLSWTGGQGEVIAVEPDRKNFKKLLKNIKKYTLANINAINAPVWSESKSLSFKENASRHSVIGQGGRETATVSVDQICEGRNISFIKFDIEGAEEKAIAGAKETIKREKPRLEIAAYHRNGDLFTIPLAINDLRPDYKIYLRHHPYIPAWETNIYAL